MNEILHLWSIKGINFVPSVSLLFDAPPSTLFLFHVPTHEKPLNLAVAITCQGYGDLSFSDSEETSSSVSMINLVVIFNTQCMSSPKTSRFSLCEANNQWFAIHHILLIEFQPVWKLTWFQRNKSFSAFDAQNGKTFNTFIY